MKKEMLLIGSLLALAGCGSSTSAPPATAGPAVPGPGDTVDEVFPELRSVQPWDVPRGGELTVAAEGGFSVILGADGKPRGTIQTPREYPLYIGNEQTGTLRCAAGRCEGKLAVPKTMQLGPARVWTRGGSQTQVQILLPESN
jgi:hypothetical protein